jgi:hypothetical protein
MTGAFSLRIRIAAMLYQNANAVVPPTSGCQVERGQAIAKCKVGLGSSLKLELESMNIALRGGSQELYM